MGVKNIDQEILKQKEPSPSYSVKSLVEVEQEEEQEPILEGTRWTKVEADLEQFGVKKLGNDFGYKDYLIDMKFGIDEVIAYADCFEIKAKYKQENNRIYFSKISQEIAYQLPTCIESEDADQIIYSFFQHDYKIETLKKESLTFRSIDIDAVIIFKSK